MLHQLESLFHWLLDTLLAMLGWLQERLWPSAVVMDGGRRVLVKKWLAEGGFGYVYLGQDAHTGDFYALKQMLCQTREALEGAKREMAYHRELRHPNLLPLLDAAIQQQHPVASSSTGIHAYLLFPYLSGGSLRDEIDRRVIRPIATTGAPGSWPENVLLRLFWGVCLGVRELHEHKPALAHKDIKPENVLLKADGVTPVLIDFGSMGTAERAITNRSEALLAQEEAAQFSTLPYRPPELFDVPSDTVLDARVDVWALGCLLYCLAFGYSPFEVEFGENGRPRVVECSFLRVIGRVAFPPKHSYSPALVETITWILQQDPKARPYVTDVLQRVDALLFAESGSAPSSMMHAAVRSGKESVAVEMAPLTGAGGDGWR